MRDTWISFRCFAGRFKLVAALLALFSSGALIAVGVAAGYYDAALARQQRAYEAQTERLQKTIDQERNINRAELASIMRQSKSNADQLAEILRIAESAASTARSAAVTAGSAAKNAASANIRVTEIPAAPPKPESPFTEVSP